MNRLSNEERIRVIAALVDGNSIRSTVHMTGVAKNTVTKLLVNIGAACSSYQNQVFRNLRCKRVQCYEILSFVGDKQDNINPKHFEDDAFSGDAWTWTAIDADTKLVPCWILGSRDAQFANAFIGDLASRLASRVQLTTDGHKPYLKAVEGAFGLDVDYAMLVKIYGQTPEGEKRYSPAQCIAIPANPNPKPISTSSVEHQSLTMRMGMRCVTRLTSTFSKKVENHTAAIALHFMYYNFVRIHQALKTTPAMAAGVSTKLWEISDIVELLNSN